MKQITELLNKYLDRMNENNREINTCVTNHDMYRRARLQYQNEIIKEIIEDLTKLQTEATEKDNKGWYGH